MQIPIIYPQTIFFSKIGRAKRGRTPEKIAGIRREVEAKLIHIADRSEAEALTFRLQAIIGLKPK